MSKIQKHFLKIYIIKYTLGYGIRFSKVWKAIRISSMGLISVMGTVNLTVPLKTVKKTEMSDKYYKNNGHRIADDC